MSRASALAALAFVLGGCVSKQEHTALDAGSRDLTCPLDDLEVSHRSDDTYLVSGCGRSGVYTCFLAVPSYQPHVYRCERKTP